MIPWIVHGSNDDVFQKIETKTKLEETVEICGAGDIIKKMIWKFWVTQDSEGKRRQNIA